MNSFYFYQADLIKDKPSFMVCFYSGGEFSLDYFCNEIVTQFESAVFTRSIVFFTHSFNKEKVTESILNAEAQSVIKDRINSFQDFDFYTCFINRNGEFELNIFNGINFQLTKNNMDRLIDFGLFNIIYKRNLIVEANSNIHFIKPSGKHTSKFIDVKNLLESSAEITFLATCLLRFLPEKLSNIYVDTSGIYPLAYEISNITRAFDKSTEIIPIDSFGSYGGIEKYNFIADANTVVLISASTSNNLFHKLRSNLSLDQASFISVIMTQVNDDSQKVLIEFDKYKDLFCKSYFEHFESYSESKCLLCLNEQSIPIALDKSRFVFGAPRTETYLPVATDSDANLKGLMRKYKDHDVFRCLFDGIDGTKKPTPEYFIDVSKVIKNDEFKSLVRSNIHRYFPLNTDCIIYCNDQGAKELADFIVEEVGYLKLKVDLFKSEIPEEVTPKKGIIVVAGSLESGKSLLNISRALRKFNELPITYIIGFAKLNSEIEFLKLKNDLTYSDGPCGKHQFHVIEKILLPINEYKSSSWEKEIELLKKIKANNSTAELLNTINEREKKLKNASSFDKQGLGDNLFNSSPIGERLVLGKTFAFWDKADTDKEFYHQSTVYFTISSILQKLRTTVGRNGTIPLGSGYIIKQLDPLLFDRFNEGIIQASVLRTAKSRELNYSSDDFRSKIVGSLIERMLRFPEYEESTGLTEFLLALCTKKLQVKKDHLISGFDNSSLDQLRHPMAWMLAEYFKECFLRDYQVEDEYIGF